MRTFIFAGAAALLQFSGYAQSKANSNPHAPGEDIYKHYTGTVGDRKVSLDLRYGWRGSSNYGGSTLLYADKKGMTKLELMQPKTFSHDETITCYEESSDDDYGMYFNMNARSGPKWTIKIDETAGTLTGKWQGTDGKQYDINLREDYTASYPMDVMEDGEEVNAKDNNKEFVLDRFFFVGVTPAPKVSATDAAFISKSLVSFADSKAAGNASWQDYPRRAAREFLEDSRQARDKARKDPGYEGDAKHRHTQLAMLFPVYNRDGIMVFENNITNILDQKSNPGVSIKVNYLCLDVKEKKQWRLSDVMRVDSAAVKALIQKEVKRLYASHKSDKPDVSFPSNAPVTGNFLLVNGGIMFSYYYPAKETLAAPETRVFISYADLAGLLTKEFKKRMGLN